MSWRPRAGAGEYRGAVARDGLGVPAGGGRAVEAAYGDLTHRHVQPPVALELEEWATAGDDDEDARHLKMHDPVADPDLVVLHRGRSLPGGGEDCKAPLPPPTLASTMWRW